MKIQVTEEHIRQGKPKDTASCPIALAIKDDPKFEKMAGSVEELGVGYNYSLADGERTVVADVRKEGLLKSRFKLPDDALQFVKQFDKGEPVKPTEFELTKASVKKSAKKKSAKKPEEDAVQPAEPEPAKVSAKKSAKKKIVKKATKKTEDAVQPAEPEPAKASAKKSAKKKTVKKAAKKTASAKKTAKATKKAAKKAAK